MGSGLGVGQELGDPHALVGPRSSCCGGREGDGTHLLEGELRAQRAPAPRVRDGTGWQPSMSCAACKEASEELGLCPSSSLTYTLKNSGKILKRTATSYQPVGCPLRQGCLWVIRTRTVSDELCRAGADAGCRWVPGLLLLSCVCLQFLGTMLPPAKLPCMPSGEIKQGKKERGHYKPMHEDAYQRKPRLVQLCDLVEHAARGSCVAEMAL